MKTIELLNKIANGEEVPKKIKYNKHIYEYEEGSYDWLYYIQNNGTMKYLLTDVFNSDDNILSILNDTVEILEEEKKIPEKLETYKDKNNSIFLDDLCYKYMPIHKDSLSFNEQVIVDKLNEIIDFLKSKGE